MKHITQFESWIDNKILSNLAVEGCRFDNRDSELLQHTPLKKSATFVISSLSQGSVAIKCFARIARNNLF